ncbi:MAG: HAMP domain-containing sensor histidine kinase [Solirubrobacterales bacterium]
MSTSPQPISRSIEPEADSPDVVARAEPLSVAPAPDSVAESGRRRRTARSTLLAQAIATNALAITALIFFCVLVLDVKTGVGARRTELVLLMLAIAAALMLNMVILRRQFAPLEKLVNTMEGIDLAQPGSRAPLPAGATEDIAELIESFNEMIARLEEERHERISAGVKAQENERARVARDLHDEANQALTAVILRLEAASQDAPPDLKPEIDEAKRLAGQAMEELLEVVRRLRPTILDLGLRNALSSQVESFGERSGIEVAFEYDGDARQRFGDERELAIYRVVQEALSNIVQHADATRVDVSLAIGETIVLRVSDNGEGFDPSQPTKRFGVSGMRERAQLVNGTLDIDSSPGEGTTLTMELP